MSYSIYNPCEEEIIDPIYDPCLDEMEHGRVQSTAYINKNYYPVLMTGPLDATKWAAGIADKSIYVIPATQGSFDGGSPVEVPGYGAQVTKISGYNFSCGYKDPNLKGNTGFYNSIKNSGNWHFAFKTETLTRISAKPVTIIPKSPVADDPASEVIWDVEVKWFEKDQPVPLEVPATVFTTA